MEMTLSKLKYGRNKLSKKYLKFKTTGYILFLKDILVINYLTVKIRTDF